MENAAAVEDARSRCAALSDRLQRLPNSKLPLTLKTTISRLIQSELNFLRLLSSASHLPSSNIGHLEAVVHVLQQPSVTGVSRVCKPINLSPDSGSVYVDIVCSLFGNPVWFVVSDRNPRCITWDSGYFHKDKGGFKQKIQHVVDAAHQSPVALRPSSVVLFFSNGVDDRVYQKLKGCDFRAVDLEMERFSCEELVLEDGWTNLVPGRLFPDALVLGIEIEKDSFRAEKNVSEMGGVVSCTKLLKDLDMVGSSSLCSFVSGMKCWCCSTLDDEEAVPLVNFDTTAMVAIVSEISNGWKGMLLATPETELRRRFKGNYNIVIGQVDSEREDPIHDVLLSSVSGKRGIICESVALEFKGLVSMCGGPNEKLRAEHFLKFLKVVPDSPSTRMMSLPTTRNLSLKNKLVFGTGDQWCAPTLTANMGFVRAVLHTGMSLPVIEHKPRSLVGYYLTG